MDKPGSSPAGRRPRCREKAPRGRDASRETCMAAQQKGERGRGFRPLRFRAPSHQETRGRGFWAAPHPLLHGFPKSSDLQPSMVGEVSVPTHLCTLSF
ncbi:hypothetical protein MC885_009957, partial [Smutsia gigantea]